MGAVEQDAQLQAEDLAFEAYREQYLIEKYLSKVIVDE